MRRLLVIGFFVCISLFLAGLAVKDSLASRLILKKFHQTYPQIALRVSGVSLLPGHLVIRHLGVDSLLVHGTADVRFAPWWFGRTPDHVDVRLDLWGVDAAGLVRAAHAQERFDL